MNASLTIVLRMSIRVNESIGFNTQINKQRSSKMFGDDEITEIKNSIGSDSDLIQFFCWRELYSMAPPCNGIIALYCNFSETSLVFEMLFNPRWYKAIQINIIIGIDTANRKCDSKWSCKFNEHLHYKKRFPIEDKKTNVYRCSLHFF